MPGLRRMKTWLKEECNSIYNGSRRSSIFHRPRILFLVALILSPIALVCAGQSDSPTGATTVYATVTESAENLTMTTTTTALNATSTDSDPTSTTENVAQNTSPISIPQPFDRAKLSDTGSNFTTISCPEFFRTFLADPGFQACVPFSLLLYTSVGFTELSRSVRHLRLVLLILGVIRSESSS